MIHTFTATTSFLVLIGVCKKNSNMDNISSPLNAILGTFQIHRLHMCLNGDAEEYDVDTASLQDVTTWIHENMNFFQKIFTGYGQIAWDAHRQMTSFIISEWLNGCMSSLDGKMRIPLGHYAKISDVHMKSALAINQAVRDLIKIGQARFWMKNPDVKIGDIYKEPWLANPTITVNNKRYILQGKEIIEGHAQFIEATYLEKITGKSRTEAWKRATLSE